MGLWSGHQISDWYRTLGNVSMCDCNVCQTARTRTRNEFLFILRIFLLKILRSKLLTAIGEGLAGRVLQTLSARHAEKLMCRVYLMQKVRAIMAFGVQNMQERPELVPMDVMPKGKKTEQIWSNWANVCLGWTKAHDEELLVAVDKFGLEDIIGKVKSTKLFESVNFEHFFVQYLPLIWSNSRLPPLLTRICCWEGSSRFVKLWRAENGMGRYPSRMSKRRPAMTCHARAAAGPRKWRWKIYKHFLCRGGDDRGGGEEMMFTLFW